MRAGLRLSDLSPEQQEIERVKKRAYNKAYRLKNADRIKKRVRQYRNEHASELKEKMARKYAENKEKYKDKNREQYLKHREKRLEYARQYGVEHHDERLAYSSARYFDKHDEIRKERREKYRANPEKIKEQSRRYRLENREKVAESKRKYNLTPNGKANHHAACVRRRVRFAINSGIRSDKGIHWTTLAEKKGSMLCSICGRECVCSADRRGALYPTVDHIIPISKGGTHTWDNVRLVCRACNASKKDKIPSQMGQGG